MKHKSKQPSGQRPLRVGEQLRHIIADTLRDGGFDDPDLAQSTLISVTEVRVAPDLKNATVFVMPLGGVRVKETLAALNAVAHEFQRAIAQQMSMKFTPRLKFEADTTFDEADKISRIIKHIHDEDQA